MAINYPNLFAAVGECIQRTNNYVGYYAELDTDLSQLQSDLQSGSFLDAAEGLVTRYTQFKGQVLNWIGLTIATAAQVLTHRVNVLEELNLPYGISQDAVLQAIIKDMIANAESVDQSTVTLSVVTEDKDNTNAGTVLVDKVLDGINQPAAGYPANLDYMGLDSELAIDDAMFAVCTIDKDTGGVAGSEQFQIGGKPAQANGKYSWEEFGSGLGAAMFPAQANSVISNFTFEDFTSDVPTNWTLDAGTAATTVLEDTGTVYGGNGGTSALRFKGNGAQASQQVSQTGSWQAGRRYLVAVYVLGDATIAAGALTIQLEGTGYSAGSSEKITMNAAALAAATSWVLKYFFVNIPKEVPSDLKLVIKVTGTLTNNANVRFDYGGMTPVAYINGHCVAVVAGSEYFVKGDKFTWTVTNDGAGIVQTFFGKAFRCQLPSDGTPTIADTVAT